jgi:DNA-3-methyladenine glycosylase II
VSAFGAPLELPVRPPFRLDLTIEALRRLASNTVDVVGSDGTYYRALHDGAGTSAIAVRARGARAIEVRATGSSAARWLDVVARMLGTTVDVTRWHERSAGIPWLAPIARTLRGVRPPRYPTLWEACAHAILFQQISIHAAAAVMRRAVDLLGAPVEAEDVRCIAFPPPQRWLDAPEAQLRGVGISTNKVAHLKSAAAAILGGTVDEAALEQMPTVEAADRLQAIRGIGAWSAAVILLRGLGRLDTFPLRDSGVARTLALLSGDPHLDQTALLEHLGDVRGMLYYHLLLGRLHDLVPR